MRKKIVWLTADYFADCDFIPVEHVLKYYDVTWIVRIPKRLPRYKDSDFDDIEKRNPEHLKVIRFHCKYRGRDPRNLLDMINMRDLCVKEKGDLYYLNIVAGLPTIKLLVDALPMERTIMTAHQGAVHAGFKMQWLAQWSRNLAYNKVRYVNMFSKSQAELFYKNYPHADVTIIPLIPKDYGLPTVKEASSADKDVVFLSFGQIAYNKNIELLIDAACKMKENGIEGFKVKIAGYASKDTWAFYETHIRHPELFELDIRLIDNEEIPNLFASSHFFVQPYRIVTQSGAMKVAYRYNVPVIVSDLPGFTDELQEGENGYKFKSEDLDDLVRVMTDMVVNIKEKYDSLREKTKNYVKANYSSESIGNKYIKMFQKIENQ